MFATLGFNVDLTGLNQFKEALKGARADTALLSRNARVLKNNLDSVNKTLVSLNGNLRLKRTDSKISGTYVELKNAVVNADKALTSISKNQPYTTKALGKIHGSIIFGESKWKRYADEVQRTKELLKDVKGKMVELRQNSTVSLRVNGSGGGSNGNRSQSGGGFFGGMMMGGMGNARNPFSFFRSMLPSVALAGAIPAAGYMTREVVVRGREQKKMENMLQMTTKDLSEMGDIVKYVREEGLRLGLSSAELGKSFAQINMSAGDKLSLSEKKTMFTGLSEFMVTMGTNEDDQKGIFRAINQMFSNNRILQEEINQLSERGIPATLVYDAAMKAYGAKNIQEIKKLQEAGKLDPAKVLPVFAKLVQDKARGSGAFDAAMQTSQTKQGQLNERFNQLSAQIMEAGLDKALANLFEGLSNLIDVLTNVTKSLNAATEGFKAFYEIVGGKGLLYGALTLLGLVLLGNTKKLSKLEGGVGKAQDKLDRFRKILDSNVVKSLARVAVRVFGLVSAFSLLSAVGDALTEKQAGKTTWMDVMFADIDYLTEKFKLFFALVRLDFLSMRRMFTTFLNPFDWGDWVAQSPKYFGNYSPQGRTGVMKHHQGYTNTMPWENNAPSPQLKAPIPKVPEIKGWGSLENKTSASPIEIKLVNETGVNMNAIYRGDVDNPAYGGSGYSVRMDGV